jgi:hypothetical protein
MPTPTLTKRVETLEDTVSGPDGMLQRLDGLTGEFLQFRAETRAEFSAVREEMREGFAAVRQEMRDMNSSLRLHMQVLHEEVLSRIALLTEGRTGRT